MLHLARLKALSAAPFIKMKLSEKPALRQRHCSAALPRVTYHRQRVVVSRHQALCLAATSKVPPTADMASRWGLFRVMVHPLTAAASVPDMVLVTIQPLVPAAARHMLQLRRYAMTPTERRVAMLMAEPGGGDMVAARAGLTLDSYRQIAKRIYAALEVDGRAMS
jgi:hypothetical protein